MSYHTVGALLPAEGWYLLRTITRRDDGERVTYREPVAGFAVVTAREYLDDVEGEPRIEALVPGDCGPELFPVSVRDKTDAGTQRLWHTGDSACSCEPYYHDPRNPNYDDLSWCVKCAGERRPDAWSE
jgi:hypothetical protein